ncbi:MAG: BrnT family toxin [Rubritepida sp.]|nr:BrnT family toxin [Rubritepida sp.]
MLPGDGFEWDEAKSAANLLKHGLDFATACRVFEGPVAERKDERRDYGEDRFQAIGLVQGRVLVVVYTWRGARRRLISARKAREDERAVFRRSLGD